ncbi:glycosyltransferase family 2 protein [Chitinophaga horti]|uniref:Glycosyltransferase family 2 protein n=1 Tax=Chitinophaga horti TaxID=2920382 RepID=A0ABY6J989_9BACT|nr:glycosyltransferase family A protein [Chitinophaga horti]UYQ95896.1 glycosyltransferase family 2 protein [Chitinophaga horti]
MKVAVCIPAYKNVQYLRRVLDSLVMQDYTDWELVVTDDSPDAAVEALLQEYQGRLPFRYYRNTPAQGMPANWNVCYDKADAEYIKIMHDDDWFTTPDALRKMAEALDQHPECDFVFSAFRECFIDHPGKEREVHCSTFYRQLLKQDPVHLFQKNFIGPPSGCMHRNRPEYRYDVRLQWLVDVDFYINLLRHKPGFVYLDEVLVNIGISDLQLTKSCHGVRTVEIPEYFYLLRKTGEQSLQSLYVYDFFWRLMRNLGVRREHELYEAGMQGETPAVVKYILKCQRPFPFRLLRIGALNKILVGLSFAGRPRK